MIKFGTGGFRAIIGDDFTKANIDLLTQATVNKIIKENAQDKPFIVGYDRRFLSDTAAKWVCEVLAGNGIQTQFINYDAPTPIIMYVVENSGAKYGMAVTASHNPAEYNGIKVFTEGGRDATEVVTNEIEAEIAKISINDVKYMDYDEAIAKGIVTIINPKNEYIDSILSVIDIEKVKSRNLKVLLDPMYGVSRTSLQTILLTCRCEVDVINDRHDALFGGRLPSPSAKTLKRLSQLVVEDGYDLGIATDGDADRIGLIDAKGNFIHPNDILVLLYYYLTQYKGWSGPAVRNIATTHLLDKLAKSFSQQCYEVPVGFKHISSKMEETNALIGGESSGGLTVRGHIRGKDGIYAASLLVEMLCVIGKPLTEILDDIKAQFGQHEMTEFDCRFSHEKKAELQHLLFQEKKLPEFPIEVEKVSYMDGCKVYFKNGGWIICRFSGTEPVIRVFCEQATMEQASTITKVMLDFLGL
ncbi:phosphoglucomutase/phosphomannomutase family protein [Paludicola sp. MB14-C6]|uniref:phosphoglucomutase/phosphomannomutase family protein n=1 Tax=Paludihabitans sp. MB14-C6 TaxID=3070656 RepID=UPI0027DEA421|nr:phosphoglucomutase/phosphomannomutase family protein [Paludicola sp. MB14-C6]WMJ22819.1 phosphoglucomutase/phosphomannomutase family protein [Paludicola sp. MB14-C6]